MTKLVLHTPWGGLGDHLQFSTLPELFTKQGHEVYISSKCELRNPQIHDLVWGCNPYILGVSDDTPNIGGSSVQCRHITNSIVSDWEISHGLEVQNLYPKIYYKPRVIPEYKSTVLVDLTSISDSYDEKQLLEKVHEFLTKEHCWDEIKLVKFTENVCTNHYNLRSYGYDNEILVHNIFDYCNLIRSCNRLVTCMSGAAVLASAIKQENILPKVNVFMAVDKKTFKFRNNSYFDLSQMKEV